MDGIQTTDEPSPNHSHTPVLFPVGRLLATPGALSALVGAGQDAMHFVTRHLCGDWGDLGEEDRRANDSALKDGARILSAYILKSGEKLWIITEWDRSATTLLLPGEY